MERDTGERHDLDGSGGQFAAVEVAYSFLGLLYAHTGSGDWPKVTWANSSEGLRAVTDEVLQGAGRWEIGQQHARDALRHWGLAAHKHDWTKDEGRD